MRGTILHFPNTPSWRGVQLTWHEYKEILKMDFFVSYQYEHLFSYAVHFLSTDFFDLTCNYI